MPCPRLPELLREDAVTGKARRVADLIAQAHSVALPDWHGSLETLVDRLQTAA